jgi:hypothetical protein
MRYYTDQHGRSVADHGLGAHYVAGAMAAPLGACPPSCVQMGAFYAKKAPEKATTEPWADNSRDASQWSDIVLWSY